MTAQIVQLITKPEGAPPVVFPKTIWLADDGGWFYKKPLLMQSEELVACAEEGAQLSLSSQENGVRHYHYYMRKPVPMFARDMLLISGILVLCALIVASAVLCLR
jgi:hypothetical protein